jgi:membrane dipeptidase
MYREEAMLIFDAHCDVLSVIGTPEELFSNTHQWDASRALSNGPFIQVLTSFAGERHRDNPKVHMEAQLKRALMSEQKHPQKLKIIRTLKDLNEAVDIMSKTKMFGLLEAEGAEILGGELSEVDRMFEMGLRVLTLAWNFDNEVCDSVAGERHHQGLSPFGRKVIERAQKLGILIDVSHSSDETFDQVIELSKKPITASHSNARALCGHRRNLTDNQIKEIAKSGGVIGMNFYPSFLAGSGNAHLMDIIRHIEYISALVGTRFIGFGSDFDGIETLPAGIRGVEDFGKIIETLLRLNYPESDVKLIAAGNYLSLLKQILLT